MIEIAADEMGGVCSTWGEVGFGGKILLKRILENEVGKRTEFMWLDLRCKWRAVVVVVMNLRFP
jgi:hypothetical protein